MECVAVVENEVNVLHWLTESEKVIKYCWWPVVFNRIDWVLLRRNVYHRITLKEGRLKSSSCGKVAAWAAMPRGIKFHHREKIPSLRCWPDCWANDTTDDRAKGKTRVCSFSWVGQSSRCWHSNRDLYWTRITSRDRFYLLLVSEIAQV